MAITFAVQRPDCHIIAIEPVPDNAECLRRNVKRNSVSNVEVIEAAVSDRGGALPMTNSGPWSYVLAGGPLLVRAITLDDFIDRQVVFVKIDTEGYEPHVLAGARSLFAKYKPLIHAEFNTYTLLLHHYDPIVFAKAIWSSCEVQGMFQLGNFLPPPADALGIVYDNITAHQGVTDLLLRPRSEIPELDAMIYSPEALALHKELAALRNGLVDVTNDETNLRQSPAIIEAKLESTIQERDAARREVAHLLLSKSWRLTAPLRNARRWLSRN
jgi:FkbM family methyltransferase